MKTINGTILKITAGKVDKGFKAEISASKNVKNIRWNVVDSKASVKMEGIADSAAISAVFDASPWSVENPVLYTFNAMVTYESGETEEISDRFGFRWFETDEKYIYLNGFPFYMRAYIRGAAAHEHQNNCNLSEFEFYKKNIRMAKSYGFNTIRFHSVIPPEECFRAADEEGILIHIEMRKENDDYNNLQEMLYGKNDFVTDEALLEIINSLYNHPSFMVYCIGNEIREPGKKPRVKEIGEFIRKILDFFKSHWRENMYLHFEIFPDTENMTVTALILMFSIWDISSLTENTAICSVIQITFFASVLLITVKW